MTLRIALMTGTAFTEPVKSEAFTMNSTSEMILAKLVKVFKNTCRMVEAFKVAEAERRKSLDGQVWIDEAGSIPDEVWAKMRARNAAKGA